jgi:hypothetical protein
MKKRLLLDEIHVSFRVAPTVADDAVAVIRRAILRRSFLTQLRQVIEQFVTSKVSSDARLRVDVSR